MCGVMHLSFFNSCLRNSDIQASWPLKIISILSRINDGNEDAISTTSLPTINISPSWRKHHQIPQNINKCYYVVIGEGLANDNISEITNIIADLTQA